MTKTPTIIKPIVEFFDLEAEDSASGKKMELFSAELAKRHPYLRGLKECLKATRGIYIFYDTRGRALYAGKAKDRSLWAELKSAFNRNRHDHQKIKRVKHPHIRVAFRTANEKLRRIRPQQVSLFELAEYVSIYEVDDNLIDTLEALLVRGFANDLMNARMEKFPKLRQPRSRRKGATVRRKKRTR
jgi:hypothetical protein